MGKRASKRKVVKKKKPGLDSTFTCPFCNHEKSIEIKMDRDRNIGSLECRICGENWQTPINCLMENVDVFCAWIDACEEAQGEQVND